jgi:hypothetical protein
MSWREFKYFLSEPLKFVEYYKNKDKHETHKHQGDLFEGEL